MLALFIALLFASTAFGLPTIEAYGSKFFTSDGDQFYIKGVAYQLTPDDPLAQGDQCQLDAALMKTLGANTIRVYHVDASANHDACMKAFDDAGIYLFVDLDTFDTYILPETPQWNRTMLDRYGQVMDAFHSYDNVAGFFIGNELMTTGASSIAAPYYKAAARDMKAYRDAKGYRKIPVGYSAADIADLRPNLQNYMACGSNSSESLDFFSLNAYEWCGQSSYTVSGYNQLEKNATDYNIPIFFSETGCNTPKPRTFDDQAAIFGPQMSGTWSGAIIYEWIQEANDYGLISYGPSVAPTATGANIAGGYTVRGTPTPISPDFPNLSNHWKTLSPSGVASSAYTPSLTAPACPAYTSGLWIVNQDVSLPTIGQTFNAAVSSSITAGDGNNANGGAATGTEASRSQASGSDSDSSSSSSHAIATGMPRVEAWLVAVLVPIMMA